MTRFLTICGLASLWGIQYLVVIPLWICFWLFGMAFGGRRFLKSYATGMIITSGGPQAIQGRTSIWEPWGLRAIQAEKRRDLVAAHDRTVAWQTEQHELAAHAVCVNGRPLGYHDPVLCGCGRPGVAPVPTHPRDLAEGWHAPAYRPNDQ